MAHADHVDIHMLQPPRPKVSIGVSILVERISWRGMHEQKARIVQCQGLRDGQFGQEAKVLGPEASARSARASRRQGT